MGKGFIQQEHPWPADERLTYGEALQFATGETACFFGQCGRKIEGFNPGAHGTVFGRFAANAGIFEEVVTDRLEGHLAEILPHHFDPGMPGNQRHANMRGTAVPHFALVRHHARTQDV